MAKNFKPQLHQAPSTFNGIDAKEVAFFGHFIGKNPQQAKIMLDALFSSRSYATKYPVFSLLSKIPHAKSPEKAAQLEWKLPVYKSSGSKIIEEASQLNPKKPGYACTPIRVIVDECGWKVGDSIGPRSADSRYRYRVTEGPKQYGGGYIITAMAYDDDRTLFLPHKYLEEGTIWSKVEASKYAELSTDFGSTEARGPQYASLMTTMNYVRKESGIISRQAWEEDKMWQFDIRTQIEGKDKVFSSMLAWKEAEFWHEYFSEIELTLLFGRSSSHLRDRNNRGIVAGPGIEQVMLDGGYVAETSSITTKFIREFFFDLYFGKVLPQERQDLYCITGEIGKTLLHDAIYGEVKDSGIVIRLSDVVKEEKGVNGIHNFGYGHQGGDWVKYYLKNGGSLTCIHEPLFDRMDLWGADLDPYTQRPEKSAWMYFWDLSGDKGESNIQIRPRTNSFSTGYTCGTWSPVGPIGKSNQFVKTQDYSGYSLFAEEEIMAQVLDPSKLGLIKFKYS